MGAQAVRLSNVDIDNALKNKDFEVLFQPIFDLGNGALARVETFVRWRHPSLGVLPPGAFISFFESQGRMSELSRYVLAEALSYYLDWRGASAPGFSINLALSDLADEAFASHFTVLLRDSGYPADLVTLECPMPPVTMDIDTAAGHFERLSETGARLAIEVRGRANDFLRQIDPFPFAEIKTGGAAILRFARTVRGPGLSAISELLEIAQNANAAITAVGVEDQASLAALRGLGFAAAQGNHLGKVGPLAGFSPTRVNEVRELLGLEALSSEDLQALFRTEAPAPKTTAAAAARASEDKPDEAPAQDDDALVERLAARVARQSSDEPAEKPAAAETQTQTKPAPTARRVDPQKIKRLRAAKAAAIARARKAAAEKAAQMENPAGAELADEAAVDDNAVARNLQERLSKEFEAAADAEFSFASDEAAEAPTESNMDEPEDKNAPENTDEAPRQTATEGAPVDSEPAEADATDDAAASAPEEAVAKAATAEEQEEPAVAASAYSGANIRASLAVGGARAHFRPGMRVGVARAAPPAPDQIAAAPVARANPAAPAKEETAPQDADESSVAPQPAAHQTPPSQMGDLADDAASETTIPDEPAVAEQPQTQPAQPARRRTKNFLTRKYDIRPPDHFWPRSWKRAWKRREREAAARKAERSEETQVSEAAE